MAHGTGNNSKVFVDQPNLGREPICECNRDKIIGLVLAALSSIALIFAFVLAGGVFGGGQMAFVAAGLAVGSTIGLGVSAFLILRDPPKDKDD